MHTFKHLNAGVEVDTKVNLCCGKDLASTNTEQCFFRPLREPVNCGARNQRGESSDPRSEDLTEWGHCNHHVDILLQSSQVLLEHVHLSNRDLFLHAKLFAYFEDWLHILGLIEIGHITAIQNVIDVLKLLLPNDLSINKEEWSLFVFAASHHQCFLNIFAPVLHRVPFNDLNLEESIVSAEGGQSRQWLSAWATNSQ